MTQINQNIDRYNNMPPGIQNRQRQQGNQPVRIPSYYNASFRDTSSVKDILEKNLVYQMIIKPFVEHPIEIVATWLALGLGLDAYSKACGGKYENSLVKKAANLGDSIQQSKLFQSKPFQYLAKGLHKAEDGGKKLVKKSAILRAMKNTPTSPEWSMAKSQMYSHKQEVVQDFVRIIDALKLDTHDMPRIKELGLSNKEKEALKKTFNVKKISEIPEEKLINQVLLERLGRTPSQIKKIQSSSGSIEAAKKEILKEMGLDANKLKKIKEDTKGIYINDVKEAARKVSGKVKIGAGHYNWMGPVTKTFERTIGCDEIYNKLHSLDNGAKTRLGRATSKAMQLIHRGLTFGGGKLGALIFISPILVELAHNVKKADKDQKVGTLIGGFVENTSWVITFPIALRMLHSLGGIKYAGMSVENVEKCKKIKEEFNKKAGDGFTDRIKNLFGSKEMNNGVFKNKAEYNKARKKAQDEIKKLSKVKGQNIFTKGLRKVMSFLTLDLANFKGYNGGGALSRMYHGMPHLMKDFVGIPMRFGVWGAISMGLLGGIITKCVTTLFGKSYDSMKIDEHKDALKEQKAFLKEDLRDRMIASARKKNQPSGLYMQSNSISSRGKVRGKEVGKDKNGNLAPQIKAQDKNAPANEKVDNYTYIPSSKNIIPHPIKPGKADNYTYVPSSECKIKSEKTNESSRKYIPSQAAANIQKNFDNSGLQSALDRAQKAEDKALKILAGNFEGM